MMQFNNLKCLFLAVMAFISFTSQAITVTDITGRQVEVPEHVKRILLGEGRMIYPLSILEKDAPFDRIVGWQGDFRDLDVQGYAAYKAIFKQIDAIPAVGGGSEDTFSIEKALALQPDLVILPLTGGHGPGAGSEAARLLESAGIAVIHVDFSQHPIKNTQKSMTILGQAIGKEQQAKQFNDYYQQKMDDVISRIPTNVPMNKKPTIFVDYLPGLQECCGSPGKGSMTDMINLAGGIGIGEKILPGAIGKLNPEYILGSEPDVYVATGVFPEGKPGITVGYSATKQAAQSSLKIISERNPIGQLNAVKQGRVHGLWHIFYDSPENIIALQSLAKWLHPDLFTDLDPEATRKEMYERFMPIPATGVFSLTLEK
ncbi:ABC transporter substrate-binding protein [Providencia sp.]|uniref:ABC transporter substrate-binding protein n=1 Tax=Providencia sp. TaxID=589 RepID=UPI003F9E77B5